ncbi:hypothetical protein F4779DRAFT_615844 [Xylariaceae sp. FL0662B]|nr:hypothetical protein F4779DRAFT_615844 [Xylariaceae sp. FL0662B]
MTGPVSGSSLPQARDVHQHHHFHHNRDHYNHYHHHTHHHVRSPNSGRKAHIRNNSEPTIIVETISVLELIDSTGSTISIQTLTPEPTTPTSNPEAHPTVDTDTGTSTSPGYSASLSVGISDDDGGSAPVTPIPTIDPTLTLSESSMPTSFPTLSYSPLTSAPLSGPSAFPSLPGVTNTTQASSTPLSNSTSLSSIGSESSNSTVSLVSISSASSAFSSASTTQSSATTTHSSSSETASSTGTGGGVFGGTGGGDAAAPPSNTSEADGESGSSGGPTAGTVAGSVIGGIAGLALILILALGIIKWKKRQNTLKLMRGSTSERGPSGTLVANSGPSGGGGSGGGGMSERRQSVPFAIPSALANLTGYKRSSGRTESSDGGERGFSKISGRKLPPVIQFGGDGYSDPRATIMSDQSIEYRDSQMFLGTPVSSRLAVGSPMRPESGVPVFNAGPARTPVTEQGPFPSSPPADASSLEPPRDPLGRSHPSHDGSSRSHGSVSRFTEDFSHAT